MAALATERTLLVVGDTLHVRDDEGRLCTHAALARQLDQWFARFDRVQIAAVLDPGPIPAGFEPYECQPDQLIPLRAAGGPGLRGKIDALVASAAWIRTLVPLLRRARVVHLRAPCNVTLVAIPLARVLSRRRYAIYAGAWDPPRGEPLSYRVQRRLLRHFGGIVHVYAPRSAKSESNVRPNFSPTFTEARLKDLSSATERRLLRIRTYPPAEHPFRIACVGRFSTNKNQALVVRAAALLRDSGTPVEVRFAGTGGTESETRTLVDHLALTTCVTFLGQSDELTVMSLFEWADVNAAPSFVEGFGRVILEGMAVGCPALCGPGPMQEDMVSGGRGVQVDPNDPSDLAAALVILRGQSPQAWMATAEACRLYASTATLERFGAAVGSIVDELEVGDAEPVQKPTTK